MYKKQKIKELRKSFREGILKRDEYKCVICGKTGNLDAHHIINRKEMPNNGYSLLNGVSLCSVCHWKAEIKEISADELYRMIGSNKEEATKDCEKL
jgi:5-methylcytosine-specific restriction endonuclease McrA